MATLHLKSPPPEPEEPRPSTPSRRRARELVVQALYQSDLLAMDLAEAVARLPEPPDAQVVDLDYFREVIQGIRADREELDGWISRTSANWDLTRVSVVDRNILRLGIYELTKRLDVPVKVVINEAVELSKRFGGDGSSRFVNGVLDHVAGAVRGPELERLRGSRSGEWKA